MRLKGTKYEKIERLPRNAVPVSRYAADNNTAVGYIYIKYERKGSAAGYTIRCFKGSNFVIPN